MVGVRFWPEAALEDQVQIGVTPLGMGYDQRRIAVQVRCFQNLVVTSHSPPTNGLHMHRAMNASLHHQRKVESHAQDRGCCSISVDRQQRTGA